MRKLYEILKASGERELSRKVREYLNAGWELTSTMGHSFWGGGWYQVMVKTAKKGKCGGPR